MVRRSMSITILGLTALAAITVGIHLLSDRSIATALLQPLGFAEEPATPDLFDQLYNRFDPTQPGHGVTDYPGNPAADVPKSYAMILMAEVERARHGYRTELPSLAHIAGRWLLDNADLDDDGVVGWGVPVAWDAYGDGSENPADTAYTISTAIVVDALLNWMQADPKAPGARIVSTVEKALRPFAGMTFRSPSGMFSYSFTPSDRPYDTFNPAAYLAGQMQRFSRLTHDETFAAGLRNAADATMAALIAEHRINQLTGSWYWTYSIQEEVTNDLPHASYIIDGILQYVENGGRLAEGFDIDAVQAHLHEFIDADAGYVRGWPHLQENIDRAVRSYGLGMAMSLACSRASLSDLGLDFARFVEMYRSDEGEFLKLPVGSDLDEPLVVNEYEAYLYHGVVVCDLARQKLAALSDADTGSSSAVFEDRVPALSSDEQSDAIGFVSPEPGATVATRLPAERGYAMERADGSRWAFLPDELPLASLAWDDETRVLLVRETGTDRLHLELRDADEGGVLWRQQIRYAESSSEPVLRAVLAHENLLYVVTFDSSRSVNLVMIYSPDGSGAKLQAQPVLLPSLGDPAGGTYEMIPAVTILGRQGGVEILGGTLSVFVSALGALGDERRLENCLRIIEVADTNNGSAVLCHAAVVQNDAGPYLIVAPEGVPVPEVRPDHVPFALEFQDGRLTVRHAESPADYRDMLVADLGNIQQAGWMEFGVSNVEGRIPWSQIYYLNGMMDLLLLVQNDASITEVFAPIAADMRRRLDLELLLIAEHWAEGRFATRAFTVDRSPALFAVQTSRLLLLFERYLTEFEAPRSVDAEFYDGVRQTVQCLDGHIEVLRQGGEAAHWMSRGSANLRWPKGSAFSFDGLAVPFNHQNEWAYAIQRSGVDPDCDRAQQAAAQMVRHFLDRVAPDGRFPQNGVWDYWWGQAYDGWTADDGISINRPDYVGDEIRAWISFRTIDIMSVLASLDTLPPSWRENVIMSALHLTHVGLVYPFASYELARRGYTVTLERDVALFYARVSSAWELQSAVWAYNSLISAD